MEIRQIRYFLAVARHLSFTRAAETLHLSQPPLSLQIKKLEDEMGTRLFVRAGHSVHLTAAGEAFVPRAQRILDELAEAVSAVQETARGMSGRLHLGFVGSASHTIVPKIVGHLRQWHPKAQLVLSDRTNSELLAGLSRRDIDLAILRAPVSADGFDMLSILREPFMAVMAENHHLAGHDSVTLRELAGIGLIMIPRHIAPMLSDTILGQFANKGLLPLINHELRGLQTILDSVAAGLGVAIQPDSVRNIRSAGLVYLPISDMEAHAELCIVYQNDTENRLVSSIVALFGGER